MRCLLTVLITVDRDSQTFAATRPSAVLLEQLGVCVSRGEPVLLVGETGTGKTSTVQYLAKLTGKLRIPKQAFVNFRSASLIVALTFFLKNVKGKQHVATAAIMSFIQDTSYW